MKKPKKVLFIRFSSIGDIILCSPAIRCLALHSPETEIHFATKDSFNWLLSHNPYLKKVHTLKNSMRELVKTLREEHFDLIIDLHNNLRTSLIKWQLAKHTHSFHKLNLRKLLYTRFHWNTLPDTHIVNRYLKTLEKLGVKYDGKGLDYFPAPESEVDLNKLGLPANTPFIALVVGAKFYTKRIPTLKLQHLVANLKYPVVLLGGPEDQDRGERVKKASNGTCINACGLLSFDGSVSVVQKSAVVITPDTGLMHAAAAFQKPIISLWGNTVPEFGMYPLYADANKPVLSKIMQVQNLECRPCSKIGYSHCPEGHFRCMNDIDYAEIIRSCELALQA